LALCVDAVNAGEKFLRRNCAVECLARTKAVIAAFTRRLRVLLAEISQQRRAPALARLGVMNHLLQLRPRNARFAFAFFIDEVELLGDIARAEKQHTFARQSVAPGPAGFL